MSPGLKKILIIVPIVIIAALGWAWYDLQTKPANQNIQTGVQKIVRGEPRLQPLYDAALADGTLSVMEANKILNKANELKVE